MSAIDRFDGDIGGALADLARPQYPDYFDSALERAMDVDQRPAWAFPERWLPMGVIALKSTLLPRWPWRRVALVVALLALILAATLFVVGSGRKAAPPFGLASNGNVIYVVDGDIYTRPIDSNVGQLLIGGPENDVSPIYSRDGTKFAIIRIDESTEEGDRASLLVANADGSGLHRIVGPEIEPHWWEWSPDGAHIAVATKAKDMPPLSIVNVDGSPVRRAVDVTFRRDALAYWRPPNGGELIILNTTGTGALLEAVKVDGSGVRTIARDAIQGPFSFTPDGRLMTYHVAPANGPMALYVVDLETGTRRQLGTNLPALANPGAGQPETANGLLTSDGVQISFLRFWDVDDAGTANHQLWVMSLGGDGSDAMPVSDVVRSDHDPFFKVMSPDGTTLLYRNDVTGEAVAADLSDGSTTTLDWVTSELADWQRLAR